MEFFLKNKKNLNRASSSDSYSFGLVTYREVVFFFLQVPSGDLLHSDSKKKIGCVNF